MNVGDLARAGNHAEVKKVLNEGGLKLLTTRYTTNLKLGQYLVTLDEKRENKDTDGDETTTNAKISVTPLHLAIISKQTNVIQGIIEGIVSKSCEYIDEADEDDRKLKVSNALQEELQRSVELQFYDSQDTYDKEDRSINGMNAIHLACKYHPKAIQIMFDILKKEDVGIDKLTRAMNNEDQKQTPLHIASRSTTAVATRCEYSQININPHGV